MSRTAPTLRCRPEPIPWLELEERQEPLDTAEEQVPDTAEPAGPEKNFGPVEGTALAKDIVPAKDIAFAGEDIGPVKDIAPAEAEPPAPAQKASTDTAPPPLPS